VKPTEARSSRAAALAGTVVLLTAFLSPPGRVQGAQASQAAKTYRTRLAPVPVPAFNPAVVGSGTVTATVTGTKLTINGSFDGLNTPATVARIHKSPKPGIRGPVLFDLTVTKTGTGTSGNIGGTFELSAAQVQELAQNRYYVQLHSEKAPDGNLWGWLQESRR
jgi:hypothetical protein